MIKSPSNPVPFQAPPPSRGGANRYVIIGAKKSGINVPVNNIGRFQKWFGRNNPIALLNDNPTSKQMKEVVERDKGRCQLCGFALGVQVHHNIRRRCGDSRPGNLHTYCSEHHNGFIHGVKKPNPWPQ